MKKLGQFEILRKLGSGAYGEVFLASGPNKKNAPLVALKVVHAHLAQDPASRKSLEDEAWAASLLSHPNVVEVYEVGDIDGVPYLAMEFIQGQSLAAVQRKLLERNELLTVGEAVYAVNQSALGLHYAHEVKDPKGRPLGLIHRDISPHNLIASDDGRVKVVDFGLAKVAADQKTKPQSIEGKMAYMPPEQINGERMDRRIDIFALGAVLWELLKGEKMYPGKGAGELMQQAMILPPPDVNLAFPELPGELRDVLAKATARNKDERYSTALELAEALEPFMEDDSANLMAMRVTELFERSPRTREEALGLSGPAPVRRVTISAKAIKPAKARKQPAAMGPVIKRVARPLITLGLIGAAAFAAYHFRAQLQGLVVATAEKTKALSDEENAPQAQQRGTLLVSATGTWVISDQSKVLGNTPLSVMLPAGRYRLKAQPVKGGRTQELDAVIKPGEQTLLDLGR